MTTTESKVIGIEVNTDVKPIKIQTYCGKEYAVPATYTLENGVKVKSKVTSRLLRDMPQSIEREKKAVEAGATKATLWEDGTVMFSTTYKLF